jgi:polysaccharide export outer membrane protein
MLVIAAVLPACSGRPIPSDNAAETAVTDYRLGPGDEVDIQVLDEESISGSRKLNGNGTLSMPLIGKVEANGLTAGELESRLRTKLTEYMRDPRVSIQVLSYRPVYLVGEVRKPGSYPYVDGMTVINAIATAGGFTYRARENRFIIDRKSTGESVAAEPHTPLLPGDTITVVERYF